MLPASCQRLIILAGTASADFDQLPSTVSLRDGNLFSAHINEFRVPLVIRRLASPRARLFIDRLPPEYPCRDR